MIEVESGDGDFNGGAWGFRYRVERFFMFRTDLPRVSDPMIPSLSFNGRSHPYVRDNRFMVVL